MQRLNNRHVVKLWLHFWSSAALLLGMIATAALGADTAPTPASGQLPPRAISLADAINLALRQGPALQRAQKNLEIAQGVEIQTRAIVIPKLGVTGNYTAVQPSSVDTISIDTPLTSGAPIAFGNDQNWRSQLRLVQSLYEGGRIMSSLRASKLIREQSLSNYQVAVADAVLEVQLAYYAVLLAEKQIAVQEASIKLLQSELTDTTRRFEAGTVPRFNVLRAEVELSNARPKLSRARNNMRLARNALSNLLGFNLANENTLEIPVFLSGSLEAEPWTLEISRALALALQQRKEIEVHRKNRALRKEEVVSAKAGNKPSLQAFAGYDVHNSMFSSDLTDELHGWMTGVQLSWDLFDGGQTAGRIRETQARYELAGVELDDLERRIELEVRTAYSVFIESDEVLKSQAKTMEQAEEALRLATARSDAGTSTQLDVLNAQTSLTDARSTQAQALHDYAAARARLERAIGAHVPELNAEGSFSTQP
jgi:outer membrane protein